MSSHQLVPKIRRGEERTMTQSFWAGPTVRRAIYAWAGPT
jgi:hypothetical protein